MISRLMSLLDGWLEGWWACFHSVFGLSVGQVFRWVVLSVR